LTHLFSNCLFGWYGETTLQVITTVHSQAAAALARESFLNLLGGGHRKRRDSPEKKKR
jgi:hypothetical protein